MARFAPKNTLPALGGLLGAALLIGYAPAAAEGAMRGTFRLRAGHSAGGVPVFGGFGIPGGGRPGARDWRPSFPG